MIQPFISVIFNVILTVIPESLKVAFRKHPPLKPTIATISSLTALAILADLVNVMDLLGISLWIFLAIYMVAITGWFLWEILRKVPSGVQKIIQERTVVAVYLQFVGVGMILFWELQTISQYTTI